MAGRNTAHSLRDFPSLAEIEQDEGVLPATPADALFGTTRRRLLGFLFGQPDRGFRIRELVESSGSGYGATHRELRRLLQAGLIRSQGRERGLRLKANPDCEIYAQLAQMVRNTFGLVAPLREAFGLVSKHIDVAFVFEGLDCEAGPYSPLELMVVTATADCAGIDLAAQVAKARLRREVRVLVVGPGELREPRWFVARALAQPRVWVFGDEARLEAMTSGP